MDSTPPRPGKSFKRPPDEAVTKEVTVGQWPKPSADKKKCVTSSTNLNQLNFFESKDVSKPPQKSPNTMTTRRLPTLETRSFSIQPRSGPPSGLQTRAKSGHLRNLWTQARSGPPSGRQTREQSGPSSGLLTRAAAWGRNQPACSLACWLVCSLLLPVCLCACYSTYFL